MSAGVGRGTRRSALRLGSTAALLLLLAGCGSNGQDTLHPVTHAAKDIASLWWWMLGGAALGLTLVVGLLVAAWRRRSLPAGSEPKPGERAGWAAVIGLGVVLPIAVVGSLFVVADIFVIGATQAPAADATAMTIDVVGHQWWWEVRYPGAAGAVTANEIHIPTGTRVNLVATTADVIHSFWVPELNRKVDTIPGKANRVLLYTDTPGVYRGQCGEFCGLQHAHMSLYVFAQRPAAFRRWLARERAPAAAPVTTLERRGRAIFLSGGCRSCHTIRGTSASGIVGPDLTHVGSRTTLAALTIPNTPSELARWIDRSQAIKPGNDMPDFHFSQRQLRALVAYLESLK